MKGRTEMADRAALTARQQQIVALVKLGLSNKEIARSLGIKTSTVKVHLSMVFDRLGLRNRRQIMLQVLTQAPVGYEHRASISSGLQDV